MFWTVQDPCLNGIKTMFQFCSGLAATNPMPGKPFLQSLHFSVKTTRGGWCIMRVCFITVRLTNVLMLRAGCMLRRRLSAHIYREIRKSRSCCANTCTIWGIRWEAWRAIFVLAKNFRSTRAALSGTTWIRRFGRPTRTGNGC